ncbi:hypothetical protein JRC04_05290 [Mycolicibacterium sp. S2-37]|uniref:hypothetical protein n=1 Tax=Mycolicibacterium sp. S2-37 TaxID=2810297 RepID=UPI001A942963|nr:hypothetical protein [Mycolicibacterium sp. S2-37]MBO0676869.1 hypothetical protein [Mycolicibacterium sp. S2-37]
MIDDVVASLTKDIYFVVGFTENGAVTTDLVADTSCAKKPEVRSYTNPATAKSFRTRAINLRDKGDYSGRRANTHAVDIRIAKITVGVDRVEWVE